MTQMLEHPTAPRPDVPLDVVDHEPSNQLTAARVLLAFVAVALIVWLCTGFYSVSASEVALIERMAQAEIQPAVGRNE